MTDVPWISALDPAGPQAAHVARLFWFFFWTTTTVFLAVMVALGWAVLRRAKADDSQVSPPPPEREGRLHRVVMACVAGTVAILAVLLVSSIWTGHLLASLGAERATTIGLVGHQWWWEVTYEDAVPSRRVVTANQIHIPVGRPVAINVTSRDVIHSFWVPALHGKRDLIPDYTSTIWIQADRAGVYRGQCAEFCGREHARMAIDVVAESPQEFSAWLDHERQPASDPATDVSRRGHDLFMTGPCASCHTIQGTTAAGLVGPDLTHVGARLHVGAGTLSNSFGNLEQWVQNSQAVKPGNRMPPHRLPPDDLRAVVTYLENLR